MKKLYYLSTCDTCRAIIKKLGGLKDFEWQDIKAQPVTPAQLKEMKALAGSYEALFSRRAIKYRKLNLKEKKLTENDYRQLILQEYTFLKRPVVIDGNVIFIGSEAGTVRQLQEHFKNG